MINMPSADQMLMLEIACSPDDCHINHTVSKAVLRRLMTLGLIWVETRRMTTWHFEPVVTGMNATERLRFWEEWGRQRRAQPWQDRSEVHARLTDAGVAWVKQFKARGPQEV